MGKEDDVWDDSALIHAFDDAISNYKTMQGRGQNDSSKAGGEVVGTMEESLSTFVDGIHEPRFPRRIQDYSNTQGAGDYTQLVNQYYGLEEQRQKILQQLQPLGSWDYQGSSVQWEQPVSASQSSYPAVVASCCPYVGQCLVAPCSFGGTCVCRTCEASSGIGHNGNPPSFEDGDIAKTAMGAAEKALSCLKTKASEKAEESHEGQAEGKAIRETDLTDVFIAWYLAEQSTAKKRHES
ncbi:hypothetical protein RHGRI_031418 [Rhododendron griersonianum]|uniref:Survival Motor Neuron Gemin2-binding domain-containing protein n=1 Tax=Rhododendron griersonianum TaxID=479676 RepID=A0AAV6I8A2_9ERIC|nr:hypothetical protein RHGRI_031418 [Rhododendron griersonianum]